MEQEKVYEVEVKTYFEDPLTKERRRGWVLTPGAALLRFMQGCGF
jgi:hypothetical protein